MQASPDIRSSLSEAWRLYRAAWKTWMLAALITVLLVAAGSVLFVLPGMLLAGLLVAGLQHMAFRQLRGQQPTLLDLFWGFSRFADAAPLLIVVMLLVAIGSMLCVVPGILLGAWYVLAFPLMVEHGIGWSEAMTESKRLVGRDLRGYVAFTLVVGFVTTLGAYICGVGLLLTLPLGVLAVAVAYRDLVGVEAL